MSYKTNLREPRHYDYIVVLPGRGWSSGGFVDGCKAGQIDVLGHIKHCE